MSMILFHLHDFHLFARLHGLAVAESLASAALRELSALAGGRLAGLSLVAVERVDEETLTLLVGASELAMERLTRAASELRQELCARIRRQSLHLTGQALDISVGTSILPTSACPNLEQALHAAMADARRMARGRLDADTATLAAEFRDILEAGLVRSVYQPVADLRGGGIFAWEALARGPAGSAFESPAVLFDFAEESGLIFALERLCRQAAIAGFGRNEGGSKLFINVHPRTLVDPSFHPGETLRLLERHGMAPHDVVLEITERHSTKDFSLFHRTLEHYRDAGYAVAVDDVGTGYSGLWSIAEIRPDFIKLDMSLVRGIDANPVKRALLETFLAFSDKVGCKIIAEGVETDSELGSLVSMGVHYGQGFFLGRPAAPRGPMRSEAVERITLNTRRQIAQPSCASPIGEHVAPIEAFTPEATVGQVKQFLESRPEASAVAVVSGRRPAGLVMRHHMDRVLSSQYGLALYSNRPVSKVMDSQALVVDWHTPVEMVARAATNRDAYKVYDHVLVTREGQLAGAASMQDILDALAEAQMEMAKGANPLTGLPGNVAIERHMERLVTGGTPVSFIYADLDNFKVYNDTYGFKAGDGVILLTARILAWAVRRHGCPDDFLGHVGGDDFVLCTRQDKADRICRAVVRCFKRLVRCCYSEEDRAAGSITGKDRSGRTGRFPLASLSMAVVDCQGPCSLESISARSAQMKKYAKSIPGNVWVRDRREPASPEDPSVPARDDR